MNTRTEQPYFSIIVAAYNAEETIERCVSSLINQTYSSIEIIIVDDGSTDATAKLIDGYAENDSRIHAIHHESNQSCLAAIKTGGKESTGKYLLFAGSDDALAPETCSVLHSELVNNPADVLQFGMQIKLAKTNQWRNQEIVNYFRPIERTLNSTEMVTECFIKRSYCWSNGAKAINGNICRRALELLAPMYLNIAEDTFLYFAVCALATNYRGIPAELYEYDYGSGESGQESLSLDKFQAICNRERIIEPLRMMTRDLNLPCIYSTALDSLDKFFKEDCTFILNSKFNKTEKKKGQKMMQDAFSKSAIASSSRQRATKLKERVCNLFNMS